MVTLNIETITPEVAKVYLGSNTSNRRISKERINKYILQMQRGEWYVSNDAICFDTNGVLINGQHRLLALIEYGKPLQFVVGRGYDEKAFAIMDTGKLRSTGDVFFINGVKNGSNAASTVRKHALLQNQMCILRSETGNGNYSKIDMSNKELYEMYEKNKSVYDTIITSSIRIYDKTNILGLSEISSCIAHLVMDLRKDFDKAYFFFAEICSLKESQNKTLESVRTRLLKNKLSVEKRMTASVKQGLIIKAWNYYNAGKEISNVIYDPNKDKDIWFQ